MPESVEEETAPTRRPSYVSLLRNRSFAALWVAQLISQSGDGIFDVALLWLVYVTTGSPALVGITQAAVIVPTVTVGPVAGVYADRLNRRNLMIASSLFQGAITAVISSLYLLGILAFSPLILLVLLLYSGAEFYRAANGAIIPSIVPKENLGAANGLFTLSTSTNQLVSYTIGGIALVTIGAAASVTYDSLTFFLAAAILTFIAKAYGRPRTEDLVSSGEEKSNFWKEFRGGLAYVRSSRLFLELSVFGLIVNFLGGGISVVIVPYVKSQLGGDAFWYGVALATFALGVIVGSVVVGKINFRAYVGKLLFGGVVATGPLDVLAGFAHTIPVGLLIFFGIGALSGALNLPLQVLVQTQVPREFLGRAATVLRALLGIAIPIAAVTFGLLAGFSSAGFVFQIVGFATMVTAAALYLPFKELRNAKY